jgi:hypothetical protein
MKMIKACMNAVKAKTIVRSSEQINSTYVHRSRQCVKIFFVKVSDINQDLENFELQYH